MFIIFLNFGFCALFVGIVDLNSTTFKWVVVSTSYIGFEGKET
jgi:hypothetical protein